MQNSEKQRCLVTNKVQYRTRIEARWVAERMFDRDRLAQFKCKDCHWWHIAHSDARNKTPIKQIGQLDDIRTWHGCGSWRGWGVRRWPAHATF